MSSSEVDFSGERSRFDGLLSKYIAVWLWSILFGTTTGVLYSFLSFHLDRWGGLGMIIAVPAMLALLFALMSWGHLYWGLKDFLIPRFIHPCDAHPDIALHEARDATPGTDPQTDATAKSPTTLDAEAIGKAPAGVPDDDRGSAKKFGFHLSRSLHLFIAAAGLRAVASVLELLLATVSR